MVYTKEQIALFEKMFTVTMEKTCYQDYHLTETGFVEEEPMDFSYNTARAHIAFSNGNEYSLDYGESNDAEGFAEDAFQKFIELNYDEEAFEKYLQNETSFHEV